MPLRNISTFPPGGFLYKQKETGFKPTPMMPFPTVIAEVLGHRRGNNLAGATREEVERDVHEFNCQRLGNDPRWCESNVKKNSNPDTRILQASPAHVKNLVARVVSAIEAIGSGTKILSEWVGDGLRPVPHGRAQSRSDVCTKGNLGHPCPFNKVSTGARAAAAAVGAKIKEQMEIKGQLTEKIQGEENLHSCEVCWCHLPLKIHVPIKTILDRTPDAMMNKFPDFCWIVQERKNPNPV